MISRKRFSESSPKFQVASRKAVIMVSAWIRSTGIASWKASPATIWITNGAATARVMRGPRR